MQEAERSKFNMNLSEGGASGAMGMGRLRGPIENQFSPVLLPARSQETSLDPYAYIYGRFLRSVQEEYPGIYKQYGNGTIFRGVDRLKLLSNIFSGRKEGAGCEMDVAKLIKEGVLLACFPLHDYFELRSLEEKWMKVCQFPLSLDVNAIKDYYGEKVGFYFAWVSFYTHFLMLASIIGFFAWVVLAVGGNDPNSPVSIFFAIFISLWCSFFLEFWKRRQVELAMQWGMVGYKQIAQVRPEFHGVDAKHPVTGDAYLYFPRNEYLKRVMQSSIIIGALIGLVLALVGGIMYFKIIMYLTGDLLVNQLQLAGTVASLLNAVQIQVMNFIYGQISIRVNDWENHRTEVAYENALTAKTFIFQFVNSYVALFYIAFVKPFIGNLDACVVSCLTELQTALSTIFLVRLATGNVLKVVGPAVDSYLRQRSETAGLDKDVELSEAEKLFMLAPYNASTEIFADYAEMVIQYGYATLFIVAYPLALIVAFVNNYVEMRVMAWKLCQLCRRPESRSSEDIGTWMDILEIVTVAAIICNSALIIFTGTMTVKYDWTIRIYSFFGMSVILITTKYAIGYFVPDMSREVEIQLERSKFVTRKLIEGEGDDEEVQYSANMKIEYVIRITDDDPL